MCCIEISITQPIPGMPEGKPAGQVCVNLDRDAFTCRIWNTPDYPVVCQRFQADPVYCGNTQAEAGQRLRILEIETRPDV